MKTINNKLKELRLQHNLKQEEVAIWLSIQCVGRVSKWERGLAMPSVKNLFKISKIYKFLPRTIYPDLFQEEDYNIPLEDPLLTHTDQHETGGVQ